MATPKGRLEAVVGLAKQDGGHPQLEFVVCVYVGVSLSSVPLLWVGLERNETEAQLFQGSPTVFQKGRNKSALGICVSL